MPTTYRLMNCDDVDIPTIVATPLLVLLVLAGEVAARGVLPVPPVPDVVGWIALVNSEVIPLVVVPVVSGPLRTVGGVKARATPGEDTVHCVAAPTVGVVGAPAIEHGLSF